MDTTRHITTELPLALWTKIIQHIREDYDRLFQELIDRQEPVRATVDEALLTIERVSHLREDLIQNLLTLKQLRLLQLELDIQVQAAKERAGITLLGCRIMAAKEYEQLYLRVFQGLPERTEPERRLTQAAERIHALKNVGQREQVRQDRSGEAVHILPVFGREDAEPWLSNARTMRSTADEIETQRQALLTHTLLSVEMEGYQAEMLGTYGVGSIPADEVADETDVEGESPEQNDLSKRFSQSSVETTLEVGGIA